MIDLIEYSENRRNDGEANRQKDRISKDMPCLVNSRWDIPIALKLHGLPLEFFCVDLDYFQGEFIFDECTL